MTPDDPLEQELAALRPRPPSPALRRGVARRLAGRRRWWWAGAAAGAIAAGIVVVLLARRADRPPDVVPGPVPPVAVATPPPTVQAYNLALARSPAALDDLLDREAVRSARAGVAAPARAAFTPDLLTMRGPAE